VSQIDSLFHSVASHVTHTYALQIPRTNFIAGTHRYRCRISAQSDNFSHSLDLSRNISQPVDTCHRPDNRFFDTVQIGQLLFPII